MPLLRIAPLLAACFALSGCTVYTVHTVRAVPAPPGQIVYHYDGSCHADATWYDRCPWALGPYPGTYVFFDGRYVLRRDAPTFVRRRHPLPDVRPAYGPYEYRRDCRRSRCAPLPPRRRPARPRRR